DDASATQGGRVDGRQAVYSRLIAIHQQRAAVDGGCARVGVVPGQDQCAEISLHKVRVTRQHGTDRGADTSAARRAVAYPDDGGLIARKVDLVALDHVAVGQELHARDV